MPSRTPLVRSPRHRQKKFQGETSASLPLNRTTRFVLCISNADENVDLEVGTVYPVLTDPKAKKINLIRVIDESGEDYLYPAGQFVSIRLPEAGKRALLRGQRAQSTP